MIYRVKVEYIYREQQNHNVATESGFLEADNMKIALEKLLDIYENGQDGLISVSIEEVNGEGILTDMDIRFIYDKEEKRGIKND